MPKAGMYDYPLYDLDYVVSKLFLVHTTLRSDEIERHVFAELLEMSLRGGAFANIITSLSKYGLVSTSRGKVILTELGKQLLYGSGKEQESSRNDAVRRIHLFDELYSLYSNNITVEQVRAFLRQRAAVDLTIVDKKSDQIFRLYRKVSHYIVENITTNENEIPVKQDTIKMATPDNERGNILKIQFGEVLIEVPSDDLDSIVLARQTLELMEARLKNK